MQLHSNNALFNKYKIQNILILLLTLIISACGGGSSDKENTTALQTATLQSITVTPTSASIAAGLTQQFTATGNYSDGTSHVIPTPTWNSSSVAVASVNSAGLVKSLSSGTSTISAKLGNITGSAQLTVTNAVLQSIVVTPASASTAAGLTQQFTAKGNYSDGTSQAILAPTWNSSNTTVASISSTGLVHSLSSGTSTITASLGSVSGNATLTVTAAVLQSIIVAPSSSIPTSTSPPSSLGIGLTEQFIARGYYSDGTYQVITSPTWSSSKTAIASVSSAGIVNSLAAGTSVISASLGGVSGSSNLTVTTLTLQSISVRTSPILPPIIIGGIPIDPSPSASTLSLTVGQTDHVYAYGHYSDGSVQLLFSAAWKSSNIAIATVTTFSTTTIGETTTISSGGNVRGLAVGDATITATFQGISGSTPATVTTGTLTSLSISGNGGLYPLHYTSTFLVNGNYSNGKSYTISNAIWSSSNTSIATVDTNGKVTLVGIGTATITALYDGKTATQTITSVAPVTKPVLTVKCNPLSPIVISATAWNDAYKKDPTDSTQWVVVDPISCAAYTSISLIAGSNTILLATQESPTVYGVAATYSTSNPVGWSGGIPPQLFTGESVVVNSNMSPLYTVTVQP